MSLNLFALSGHYKEIPHHLYRKWFGMLFFSVLIELMCYLTAPFVALFVVKRERKDRVKRIDNKQHTMMREYLTPLFYKWQTHDNAVDEWYWGAFAKDEYGDDWTVEQYLADTLAGKWRRYYCRVMWLWRNTAYGFLVDNLGEPHEPEYQWRDEYGKEDSGDVWSQLTVYKHYFLLEQQIPTGKGRYRSIKIGWKHHKGYHRVLYANRVGLTRKLYKG